MKKSLTFYKVKTFLPLLVNNIKINAKNNSMTAVYLSAIIFFMLYFPLKILGYGYFDLVKKSYSFGVFLFGVKLISGYLIFSKKTLDLYIGKRPVKRIRYYEFLDVKKEFEPLKGYWLKDLFFIAEFGGNSLEKPIKTAFISSALVETFFRLFSRKLHGARVGADYFVRADKKSINFTVKVGVVFNILTVIISLIIILMEKGVKWGKNKRAKFRI